MAAFWPALAACASSPYLDSRLGKFSLEPHHFPGTGRGLRTSEARAAGQLLLAVDDREVVTAERVLMKHADLSAAAAYVAEHEKALLTDEALLALFVAREQAACSDYASTLPTYQPSGVCMKAEDRLLLPRAYSECVLATIRYAVEQYQACVSALQRVGAADISETQFLMAFAHVRARSVEVSDDQGGAIESPSELLRTGSGRRRALLPAFDLLNHQAGATTTLVRDGKLWTVTAHDAYEAGDQVFVTYGERDNLKFLLQYGFVLESNEDSVVLFDCRDLVEGCVAARSHLFAEVQDALLEQLTAAQEAADAPEAAECADDEKGTAFQRLALFTYDATAKVPRESLQGALNMMETVLPALGASETEIETFVADALHAMLTARRKELSERLEDIAKLPAHKPGSVEAGESMRSGIATLLRVEREALDVALSHQAP